MHKLINPERNNPGYHCYGCCPDNLRGLKMEFWEDGEDILAIWNPDKDFQSYENILHGGVQMALLDETACWVMMVKAGTSGYTRRMEVDFEKPVFVSRGEIYIRGTLRCIEGDVAWIDLWISEANGKIRTRACAEFFVLPESIAIKRLQ